MLVPAEVGSVTVITKPAPPYLRTRMAKENGHLGPLLGLARQGWRKENVSQWRVLPGLPRS